jgi:hypothetical protein
MENWGSKGEMHGFSEGMFDSILVPFDVLYTKSCIFLDCGILE